MTIGAENSYPEHPDLRKGLLSDSSGAGWYIPATCTQAGAHTAAQSFQMQAASA